MKKYLVILASAVLALSMASCSKEEAVKDNAKASTTVYLKALLNNTKTVANADDPTKTEWESSDAISVFVSTEGSTDYSDNTKFTVANAAEGIFTGEVEKTFDEEEIYSWSMLYPYTSAIDSPASTTKYLTLGSATQTQKKADDYSHALAGKYVPLVGTALSIGDKFDEGEPATMHHLTSVVKYNITNTESEPIVITSIRFDAAAEISGTYYVDFSDVENIKYTAKGANKNVTLILTDGTIAAGETASFYVVTRPFEVAASSSNSITITADKGQIKKTWTPSAKVSVEAGAIQAFNINYVAPVATSFATINEGKTADTYYTPSATVVAAGGSYSVAYDGTDYMLLYNSQIDGATKLPTVGTNYSVSGSVVRYWGIMEWSYPVVDAIGEATAVTHKTLEQYDEDALLAFAANAPANQTDDPTLALHYIEIEGSVASKKMTVGEQTVNLISSETIVDGEGTVKGYLYGYNSSKKTFNVLVTETDIEETTVEGITLTAPYTLKFAKNTGNTAYANTYTVTVDNVKWIVPGNQGLDAGLKLGGKLTEATDRAILSQTPIANNFKSVTVTHGSGDTAITVNSMTLSVYPTATDAVNGTNAVATISGTYANSGTTTFTKTGTESWANCFYKINYNMSSSAPSSNKGIIFVNAVFAE